MLIPYPNFIMLSKNREKKNMVYVFRFVFPFDDFIFVCICFNYRLY